MWLVIKAYSTDHGNNIEMGPTIGAGKGGRRFSSAGKDRPPSRVEG